MKKNKFIQLIEKLFDFMASLKLAVIVIVLIAVISAVGTIYESMYDRVYAQKLVYHSFWMWMILALLAVNITAVLFDRWPWKRHHLSFIFAHFGIIILLIGSVITYVAGLDGSMVFEIGGKNRFVQLQDNEVAIYTSLDGAQYRSLFDQRVDFFNRNLKKNPLEIKLKEGLFQVIEYNHFTVPEQKIVASEEKSESPAIQFLIEGSRATESSWLFKDKTKMLDNFQMGPASVTLADADYQRVDKNEIIFKVKNDQLHYEIYKEGQDKATKTGVWKLGDVIETGWMDFKVRVLNFYPDANVERKFIPQQYPSALTVPAIKVKYKEKTYDVGLNSPLKIFESDRVHVFTWGGRRHDIGFEMKLNKFNVGRYQGTNKAMTYESLVEVEGEAKPIVISMNEPFDKAGLRFFQSSFQEDKEGNPTHSVFSVNKDPGRWVKYMGSLLIFLGIIMLFYFRDIYSVKYKKRFGDKK